MRSSTRLPAFERIVFESRSPMFASAGVKKETTTLDGIDRQILAILQDDSSISIAAIAEQIGLSQTPCWKRIQRLEATGVILKRVALLAPDKLGLGLTVMVSIQLGDHVDGNLLRFTDAISAMPEVMDVYRVAGDVDYMLRVVVPDVETYDAFYKRLVALAPLKRVVAHFAMECVKSSSSLPIAGASRARSSGRVQPQPCQESSRRGRPRRESEI
jgi:Lrp/AsnC family transcriptional regulator